MDKIIHDHLDRRLELQDKAAEALDKAFEQMSIDALLANPQQELERIAELAQAIGSAAIKEAAKEGVRFAKAVKKRDAQDKGIIYEDSDNPRENAGELK